MFDDKVLLELCLKVSGSFENGVGASYTTVAGSQDDMGLSCGVLQWNAGQGTLQTLVKAIGTAMGWEKAKTFFTSDIQQFSQLPAGQSAIDWCIQHYLVSGSKDVEPSARQRWVDFLSQPESIAAQVQIASNGVLGHAKREVLTYTPDYTASTRSVCFFFDLVTQDGSMTAGKHTVPPILVGQIPEISDALAFAKANNVVCHDLWEAVVSTDKEAALLLWYAYARTMLANPRFQWDALSRRGTIACRKGIVHEANIDFTNILD